MTAAAGRLFIVQVLQDGTADGTVSITSITNAEDLAGTDNVLTYIGAFDVGASQEAIQHLWIGRCLSSSAPVITGANSGTDDIYIRARSFANTSIGTTLATVIENGSAGGTANVTGTSNTASDAGVTTLGPDRLALQFLGINDDNTPVQFTGMSGGTWDPWLTYANASGTDGSVSTAIATMVTAGTIGGGTGSIVDSDAWGVVGFALIGTTPDAARVPHASPYPQLIPH